MLNLVSAQKMTRSSSAIALLLAFMLGLSLTFQPLVADAAQGSSPVSGPIGTIFTIQGSGFQAGERVNLSTTDPKESNLSASYVITDQLGKFTIKVDTTDPQGLAATAGGNYTTEITDYDSDGNPVDQYLQLILFKPSVGNWTLNALGSVSNSAQAYNFTISPPVTASSPATSSPGTGPLGTVFTLKAGGFLPNEKVALWTTDPNSKDLDASFILADANGNIMLKVNSSDPQGLAVAQGGNYATLGTDYDADGLVVDQYLQVILYNPGAGNWHLTAFGTTSAATQVFSFNVTQ